VQRRREATDDADAAGESATKAGAT